MKDLIINGFEKGIGQSPHTGFQDMSNISTDLLGTASIGYALESDTNASKSNVAISACSDANNTFTVVSGALGTETIVAGTFGGGTVQPGFSNGVYYWFSRQNATTYKVSVSYEAAKAGTFMDVTSDTPGTSTINTTERPVNAFQSVTSNGTRLFAVETNKVWTRLVTAGSKWHLMKYENTQTYKDIVYWRGYVLVFSTDKIGYYGPIKDENDMDGGTITWDFDWKSATWNGVSLQAHKLQNDFVYYITANNAAGKAIVGSFNETAGDFFDPTDVASYNQNTAAIDLPQGTIITCLGETGLTLLIGTNDGVYSWDTIAASFNLPVLRGSYVNSIVNYSNLAYIFAGEKNDIYATNGAVAELVARLPEHFFGSGCTLIPHATCVFNDKILFLPAYNVDGYTQTEAWSFEPSTKVFKIQFVVGDNTAGDSSGAVFQISKTDFFASAGTGFAISSASRKNATSYSAFFISPAYQVGLPLRKKRMSKMKVILDRPLASGQGIRVSTRTSLSDSWTVRLTFDYATHGAKESIEASLRQVEAQLIQFKVELTTGASSTTTPFLREIRFS